MTNTQTLGEKTKKLSPNTKLCDAIIEQYEQKGLFVDPVNVYRDIRYVTKGTYVDKGISTCKMIYVNTGIYSYRICICRYHKNMACWSEECKSCLLPIDQYHFICWDYQSINKLLMKTTVLHLNRTWPAPQLVYLYTGNRYRRSSDKYKGNIYILYTQ